MKINGVEFDHHFDTELFREGKTEGIEITIDTKFASNFQQHTHMSMLATILYAWQIHLAEAHKGNKVKIEIKLK